MHRAKHIRTGYTYTYTVIQIRTSTLLYASMSYTRKICISRLLYRKKFLEWLSTRQDLRQKKLPKLETSRAINTRHFHAFMLCIGKIYFNFTTKMPYVTHPVFCTTAKVCQITVLYALLRVMVSAAITSLFPYQS